jgi:hypothetical protein
MKSLQMLFDDMTALLQASSPEGLKQLKRKHAQLFRK